MAKAVGADGRRNARPALDSVDWDLIELLQDDGRLSFAALGKRVHLSAPAVAERVKRLEEWGVIQGYSARVDLEHLDRNLVAFVSVRYPSGNYEPFRKVVMDHPAVLECHHVAGSECFIVKTAVASMKELEGLVGRLARFGSVTTSIVYSSPVRRRVIRRPTTT